MRILQSLPPLIELFKQIEARIVRSGVWSVSKNELTSALAGNTTTAEKPKVPLVCVRCQKCRAANTKVHTLAAALSVCCPYCVRLGVGDR